jgi:F-type H+-transporting ATPase subunit gamma
VGRRGRDFFGRRGFDTLFERVNIFQKLQYAEAQAIGQIAVDCFVSEQVDRVVLVYNEFKSVISQRVVVDQLLPIARAEFGNAGDVGKVVDYLYEPSPQEIFNQLLPRYIDVQVYRALLESNAAFFAAQMTAMDTATKNSAEMIASLTLYMNKVRQAAISSNPGL